jgi:hypothetical protein
MSIRLLTELWLLCLILLSPVLIFGVLRWERATTKKCVAAVTAHDANQLDELFWLHRFAPGTRRVVNYWTTDFGDFPGQAACDSTRPVEMPGADRMLDLRLWLLSPVIPVIRHRLEVQIGDDGKVADARYDTHEWYFTPSYAGGGSFTNQGMSFRIFIPIPFLVGLATLSWLLAIASRALGRRLAKRHAVPSPSL